MEFWSRRRDRRYDALMADLNRMAFRIVQESTEPTTRKTPAQPQGREHGAKGGKTRAAKLSPASDAQRSPARPLRPAGVTAPSQTPRASKTRKLPAAAGRFALFA